MDNGIHDGYRYIYIDGKSILISDIISCKLDDSECHIIAYPLENGCRVRFAQSVGLHKNNKRKFETIRDNLVRPHPPHLQKATSNNTVLLISNPFSGQKKAVDLWNQYGKIVMSDADINVECVVTEYPNHATQLVRSLDLEKYDAILINSGDGLVTEVLRGLLMRGDREVSIKVPLCHIPGGTSNALAATVLFACNEPFSTRDVFVRECAIMATIPRYLPVRLFCVETENSGRVPMCLSANWGLIADIDLGSERFRWAGMARLHIEAIIRILQLPRVARYRAKLSYLPVKDKALLQKCRIPHDADREEFGKNHFIYDQIEPEFSENVSKREDYLTVEVALADQKLNIPSLKEKLTDDWVTIEGEYVMVNVTTLSHLGSDVPFIPSARMGSEIFYLTFIDWETVKTRFHVADLFIRMNRGVHLQYGCLQIIPVYGVRVEPMENVGYFAIDGEPYPSGAFQVAPMSFTATVVGRPPIPS